MQQELREILTAGLAAADPEEAVRRSLRFEDGAIIAAGERLDPERVYVLAAGKAAPLMARAAVEILGERVVGGLVVAKDGSEKGPDRLETLFAAHPEPDERGRRPQKGPENSHNLLERTTCYWPSSPAAPLRYWQTRQGGSRCRSSKGSPGSFWAAGLL